MKIFVTGISGLLGLNMALELRDRHDIRGCYLQHAVRLDGVEALRVDVTRRERVSQALRGFRPDVVIHTAGLTGVDACERDPSRAQLLNVEATRNVADLARQVSAKFVHISTDHLFGGTHGVQRETDEPNPPNTYARSKLEAERIVAGAECLIIRTNFYGWGPPHRASFSDWIIQGLRQRRPLPMFRDVTFSPILANHLVQHILELVGRGATGIFNVGGRDRITKWQFGQDLARVFGLDPGPIRSASVHQAGLLAPRPLESALDCSKVETVLGRPMRPVREDLEALKRLEREHWPNRVAGAVEAPPPAPRGAAA